MGSVSDYLPIAYLFVLSVAILFFLAYLFMIYVLYK